MFKFNINCKCNQLSFWLRVPTPYLLPFFFSSPVLWKNYTRVILETHRLCPFIWRLNGISSALAAFGLIWWFFFSLFFSIPRFSYLLAFRTFSPIMLCFVAKYMKHLRAMKYLTKSKASKVLRFKQRKRQIKTEKVKF